MFRSHKDICQFMADIQDLQKFFASSEDLHSIVRNREETVFRKEGIMNSNKMKKTRNHSSLTFPRTEFRVLRKILYL